MRYQHVVIERKAPGFKLQNDPRSLELPPVSLQLTYLVTHMDRSIHRVVGVGLRTRLVGSEVTGPDRSRASRWMSIEVTLHGYRGTY